MNTDEIKGFITKFGMFPGIQEFKHDYTDTSTKLFAIDVKWEETNDANHPFTTTVNNHHWKIRLNDFPEEPMYTLLIDNKAILTFDDIPANWKLPTARAGMSK